MWTPFSSGLAWTAEDSRKQQKQQAGNWKPENCMRKKLQAGNWKQQNTASWKQGAAETGSWKLEAAETGRGTNCKLETACSRNCKQQKLQAGIDAGPCAPDAR
jgi:hypothetical protein